MKLSVRIVQVLGLVILSMAIYGRASAARTVRIVAASTGVQLTNPSTSSSVNYDISCFSQSGTEIISSTGQILAAKSTTTVGGIKLMSSFVPASSICTSGTGSSCGNIAICPGAKTYATAQDLCGEGLEVCGYSSSVSSTNFYGAGDNNWYWVKPPTATVVIGTSCGFTAGDPGNVTFDPATEGLVFGQSSATTSVLPRNDPDVKCTVDNGTTIVQKCDAVPKTSLFGAACCEKTLSASYCAVTINSSDASLHLISPQFKGGTPF